MHKPVIGDIIDHRSDGSYVYLSHKGVLNLDSLAELYEEMAEDQGYLDSFLTYAVPNHNM